MLVYFDFGGLIPGKEHFFMPMITFVERIRNILFFSRHQTLLAFLFILLLSVWVLNANPFTGRTVAPFDLLLAQPGWETVPWDNKVRNNEASDILDGQLPTWITLKEQIRAGKGALWYPYAAGGKAMDLEPFNPTFLLFLVIKDNAVAYYMVGLLKLVISGFGGFLLLRTFLKWAPSMWGGIVFMLCGFNVAWFFYEQVATAMWIPWLLAATVMYLRTEDLKWLPAIAVISFLLILGGFLSVAAFGLYSFGLLILTWNGHDLFVHYVRAEVKDSTRLRLYLKKSILPMFAVAIGFMLSAITLIPFIAGLSGINLSYRGGTAYGTGTIFGAGTNFTGGVRDLLLLFFYEYPIHIERTAYIGVPVVILAFISIFRLFRGEDEDYRKFIFFNLLLVVLAALIAFGLLPHEFIRTLPIFKNNSWGRLVVVLLLGLSVLSAVGLDFVIKELPALLSRYLKMAPVLAGQAVIVAAILVAGFQFGSQKVFFNDCVAVVPSAWFYPLTPSIQYVRERLKPLQSVIADNSFSISGTLGAYGIPEWYGHSLFTDREKEVLSNLVVFPFGSPTSAFISTANIDFNSQLMDKLVIKYLLIDRNRALHKTLQSSPGGSYEQAPPLPANSWRQCIYAGKDMSVDAVGFKFATYGEANAPSNLLLRLFNENGEPFAESELNSGDIADNSWALFEFSKPVYLSKGVYYMELSLPGYPGPRGLTAWASRNKDAGANYLEINGEKTDLSLEWQMAYFERVDSNVFGSKWDFISLEKNIAVLENKNVTNSAYFMKDLDESNDRLDFTGLDVRQASSEEIDIAYSGQTSGWVVLPMRLNPGWRAYIDNRQVDYDTYLGIMPAIPVNGPAKIVFSYRSAPFKNGLTVSLAGFCGLLVFSVVCFKKSRQAGQHHNTEGPYETHNTDPVL